MPPKQPVKRKLPKPSDATSAAAVCGAVAVKLWSEDQVVALDAESKKEVKKLARKKVRNAKKRAKSVAAKNTLEELSEEAEVIIALDMSTSPGLAIVDRSASPVKYQLVAFSQTDKQQTGFDAVSKQQKTPGKIRSLLPSGAVVDLYIYRAPKEGAYPHNTAFYEIITAKMMEFIRPYNTKNALVVIEAYAYHILKSSSITTLAELGGVIRNKLYSARLPFLEVSATAIKKWFTGQGVADKPEMWKAFQKIAPDVKLDEWLPAPFSDTNIPCPHQDIVDAFASAHSLHLESAPAFYNKNPNSGSDSDSDSDSREFSDDEKEKPKRARKKVK